MVNVKALPLELAAEGLQAGWTKEQVILALCAKVKRDTSYLARRARAGTHTSYDEQTESDLYALALAACWLIEETTDGPAQS